VNVLKAAAAAMAEGTRAALVTVIGIEGSAPRRSGARMLVFEDGSIVGTIGGGHFELKVIEAAIETIKTGHPTRFSANLTRDLGMCCGGAMEAYIEPLEAIVDVVIYGAGHVGRATANMAAQSGFRVTVIDERPEFADAELFDDRIDVKCVDPLLELERLPWGANSFHLVLTHSHSLDQDLVAAILPRPLGWLGMIGSRTKVAKFFLRFRSAGIDETLFSKLSAPVGLDINAETPEEIAISILAEMVRVKRNAVQTPAPLSEHPIDARGGDGRAHPPAFTWTE